MDVSIYDSICEHKHIKPQLGLTNKLKDIISNLFNEESKKPHQIIRILESRNIVLPIKSQIVNFLHILIKTKFGPYDINLSHVNQFCVSNTKIPEKCDVPYIIFFSTPRLLKLMNNSHFLQTDATYKMIYQRYPVLMIGRSDINRKFHPGGSCDNNGLMDPMVLVADSSTAITKAFEEVFIIEKIIYCFFHMIKAITKHTSFCAIPKCDRMELRRDINFLQISSSVDIYNVAKNLFLTKWNQYFVVFCSHNFVSILLNNGFAKSEATNGVIKRQMTVREHIPLNQFFSVICKDILLIWSLDTKQYLQYSSNSKLETKKWTNTYSWAKENQLVRIKTLTNDVTKCYIISDMKNVDLDYEINTYQAKSWKNFNHFKESISLVIVVIINKLKWEKATCTCSTYLKCYTSKHSLDMAIRLKCDECVVPIEAKLLPLRQKRKRGRPSLVKEALYYQ
ncbi:hypothetical protein A3Q56_05042 [Intoshia linei]|uniref:MULE transposase domain-containing protein n=1 Tax=Intoshia linei TaxID=1819745 RepID=A0A177AZF6_9BILA|nr:hypothetical protein A3Q56_05042 [Intoshia linei]